MIANMGLTIKAMNMENMFGQSMLILHGKCFIPTLVFGITGFEITALEMNRIDNKDGVIQKKVNDVEQGKPRRN